MTTAEAERTPAARPHPGESRRQCLVIGYGNELRGDDAAGPEVARAIDQFGLPETRALCLPQLTPEVAHDIAQADRVIFVDAALDVAVVTVSALTPVSEANIIAHANSPEAILALAKAVFDRSPEAWSVRIPVADLSFRNTLTPLAETGAAAAIDHIIRLCTKSLSSKAR